MRNKVDAADIEHELMSLLDRAFCCGHEEETNESILLDSANRVSTLAEHGGLTYDRGIVVRRSNGQKIYITVQVR